MRRFCTIGLLVAVGLCGAIVFFSQVRSTQPQYQGKPLAWWIQERGGSRSAVQIQSAEEALLQMGTNGLPFILRELQTRDNRATDWLVQLLRRTRLFRIQSTPPSVRRYHAEMALTIIGRKIGKQSLVALMAHRDVHVREAAAQALAWFPIPEGQKALVAALDDENKCVRAAAAKALRLGGYFPFEAIIPLSKCLNDSNADLQSCAAETLSEYCRMYHGGIPKTAITNLLSSLSCSNATVRRYVAAALSNAQFRPKP